MSAGEETATTATATSTKKNTKITLDGAIRSISSSYIKSDIPKFKSGTPLEFMPRSSRALRSVSRCSRVWF